MNSLEKKTMHNEKAKRIRNAHRAFVEKTMEGATRILKKGVLRETETNSGRYEFVIFAVVYVRPGQNASLIT